MEYYYSVFNASTRYYRIKWNNLTYTVLWLNFTFIIMHRSCYPTARLSNKLFNTHIKSVEGQGLSLIIVHDLQVYLAYLAVACKFQISAEHLNTH